MLAKPMLYLSRVEPHMLAGTIDMVNPVRWCV